MGHYDIWVCQCQNRGKTIRHSICSLLSVPLFQEYRIKVPFSVLLKTFVTSKSFESLSHYTFPGEIQNLSITEKTFSSISQLVL